MDVVVDWDELARRRGRVAKRIVGDAIDVVITGEIDGAPAPSLTRAVREVILDAGLVGQGEGSAIWPTRALHITSEGLSVWLDTPWRERLERIVQALTDAPQLANVGGRLVVSMQAARFPEDGFHRLPSTPALVLALPMTSTLAEGPRNEWGAPLMTWRASDAMTEKVTAAATEFVFDPAWGAPTPEQILATPFGAMLLEDFRATRVLRADAPAALREALELLSIHLVELRTSTHSASTINDAPDACASGVAFRAGGICSWVHHGPATAAAKIQCLLAVAARFAPDLDGGAIYPGTAFNSAINGAEDWDGWLNRDALRDQVPEVSPYLIVTDRHLARAGTLDGWTVTPFATGLSLLALDLEPGHLERLASDRRAFYYWRMIDPYQGPTPDYLAAREALGDMLYQPPTEPTVSPVMPLTQLLQGENPAGVQSLPPTGQTRAQ
ncbi:hypothetical protein [Lapillicoccus jejuensis]|uniref:Uncharacterized protein n=1 Tax=Lapillicoccus jejuensis TaxID=402171 RepID=A0A542DXD8_9MICO|nr:hypothetical protein [Lapillicoccus jejuensis]TQJ07584.1 hypothetical protein FB458_0649 [Lapillicoccus jejuensis]